MIDKMKYLTFEKSTYYSLIAFAFTLPLSRAAVSFFVFWFLLLVLVKKDYKNSFFVLKDNKIFFYFFIFLGYIFLSSLWSNYEETTLSLLNKYFYWIIVPCIVILAKKEWLYTILNSFLLGMFVSEIISYGIYFELWTMEGSSPSQPSPFMLTIHYSVFLAFTALVLLYRFLFEDEALKVKIILFVFFIITTTNLFISTGRTGQLSFFVTLFIVFIMKYRITLKSFLLSGIFAISIFFIAYNSLDLFKHRVDGALSDINKVVLNDDFQSSWGIRAAYWILTYDAMKESPLVGHGLGDYSLVAKDMIDKYKYTDFSEYVKDFLVNQHYHNQYLMIVVDGGFLGLFLFILFIYKLYQLKTDKIEVKHMYIIGITVFLISFIGEPLLFFKFPQILFLFIVSFAIISSKRNIKN